MLPCMKQVAWKHSSDSNALSALILLVPRVTRSSHRDEESPVFWQESRGREVRVEDFVGC